MLDTFFSGCDKAFVRVAWRDRRPESHEHRAEKKFEQGGTDTSGGKTRGTRSALFALGGDEETIG